MQKSIANVYEYTMKMFLISERCSSIGLCFIVFDILINSLRILFSTFVEFTTDDK